MLPKLGDGAWSVGGSATSDTATYKDKLGTASVTTRPFDKASCDQQRTAFAERGDAGAVELEVSAEGKALGVQWSARVATRKPVHGLLAMCVERGMGGVVIQLRIGDPHVLQQREIFIERVGVLVEHGDAAVEAAD